MTHSFSYQLAALNPQIDDRCFNLNPGEVLCLGQTEAEDCKDVYTVQRDEYVRFLVECVILVLIGRFAAPARASKTPTA